LTPTGGYRATCAQIFHGSEPGTSTFAQANPNQIRLTIAVQIQR
jgi:hypothetical protein